jgi:hypothetical protein
VLDRDYVGDRRRRSDDDLGVRMPDGHIAHSRIVTSPRAIDTQWNTGLGAGNVGYSRNELCTFQER